MSNLGQKRGQHTLTQTNWQMVILEGFNKALHWFWKRAYIEKKELEKIKNYWLIEWSFWKYKDYKYFF